MRPIIPEDKLEKWEKNRQNYLSNIGDLFIGDKISPDLFYAAEWLREKLVENKCEDSLLLKISEAFGQKTSVTNDVWAVAIKTIEDYKLGIWDLPGEELALKLYREKFGQHPNPIEVKKWLIDKGFNPEKLIEYEFRMLMGEDIRHEIFYK